jgi:TonB-dependent receptor
MHRPYAAVLAVQAISGICMAAGTPGHDAAEDAASSASGGNALQEITISAQRTTEEQAREAQMEAPNLIDIATYTEIRKLPDVSTGEAVRRIPGISLETDEGEGRYVNIRGFDADLNSTTFAGLRLPPTNNASPFGGYRAVTLDSIPIGLVGALTVTKSNLPSMDAEALGGTIEITPKTAPTNGAWFAEGNVGSGYEPLRQKPVIDVAITTGGRFGGPGRPSDSAVDAYSDRPFSVVLTYSFNENWRGIDDVEPAYINGGGAPYYSINNIQQRDYELNRKRHGYGIDLGYQPDPDNSYYVRAFDAGYTERYYRQFLNLTPDGNATLLGNGMIEDTLQSPTSNPIQKDMRDEKETSKDQVAMVGGRNDFDGIILDYRLGFTKGDWSKAYDYNSAFTYTGPATGVIDYSPTGRGHTPIYTITGANYLDPTLYQLTQFSNSTAYNYDKERSLAVNLEVPLHWGGFDKESLKVGANARLRHKGTSTQPYSYPNLPNLLLSDAGYGPDEIYYASQYHNGIDIRPGYLQTLLAGQATQLITDQASSLQQYLDAKEDVYAAYLQYEMGIGPLGIVGGVRVERTKDTLGAYKVSYTNGAPSTDPVTGALIYSPVRADNSYTNAFPGLQTRYEIMPTLVARAAYSATIARPGFNQVNASQTIDLGSGFLTEGNPKLKPATANNYDISIEQYLPNAGIVSLGLFDKEIKNYIVNNNLGIVIDPASGLPLKHNTYVNAGPSYARGLELNWEQRFTELPGPLSGLGAGANLTLVDSRFEIRPGEHSRLPSTSKETWNASIFYEKYGLGLKLAAYSVSADLFAIGSDKTSDVYNARRTSMDFGSTYAFSKQLGIYFNIKNLLNTPHAFYQGTPDRPIQREFYSQDYLFGVRYDFEGK